MYVRQVVAEDGVEIQTTPPPPPPPIVSTNTHTHPPTHLSIPLPVSQVVAEDGVEIQDCMWGHDDLSHFLHHRLQAEGEGGGELER